MAARGKLREVLKRYYSDAGAGTPESRRWLILREWLLFLLLAILVYCIYAHCAAGPFVFDDIQNIAENQHIRMTHVDFESLRRAAFDSPIPTRPVANLSFALNYCLTELETRWFRLVNVLIHIGNGALLLFFLKATLRTPALRACSYSKNWFMPFAAVALWIVNPVHTQSVSYIVQRMNTMAAFFSLLAFLLYIYARFAQNNHQRRPWLLFVSSLLAFLLALGSKENSITLPFFIFLYEWYFFRDLSGKWLKRNYIWPLAVFFFWLAIALLYLDLNPWETITSGYQSRDFSLGQRIMTQSRVVVFYLVLFLFPHPSLLNLDHNFQVSLSPIEPMTTLLSILVIIAVLAIAVSCARRERFISFCLCWFFGNLVVESSVIGLEMVFEHRTYYPTFLISMVVVILLYRFVAQVWARRVVLLIIVVTGTIWTSERNMVWSNDIALWDDSLRKSPGKIRPYVNLGLAYKENGQFGQAIHYLEKAVKLKPDYVKARYNLSIALLSTGEYQQAEQHASEAQRLTPDDPDTINALGIALAQQGLLGAAIDNFSKALELNPHDADTHFNLSIALANSGKISRALWHCTEALRIKPDYREADLHLQKIRQQIIINKVPIDKPFSKPIANIL